jgi:hypothetical protein
MKEKLGKFKTWLKNAGFTSGVYLALFLVTLLFGSSILGSGLAKYLAGAFIGIFCYINWNVLVKVFKEDVVKKVEEKIK